MRRLWARVDSNRTDFVKLWNARNLAACPEAKAQIKLAQIKLARHLTVGRGDQADKAAARRMQQGSHFSASTAPHRASGANSPNTMTSRHWLTNSGS